MTETDIINRYKESSLRNLETARDLLSDKHFDWALFLGQLALEKLLKAYIIKDTQKLPPHIHDLLKLAQVSHLDINKSQQEWLIEITKYHIQARYDDIKYELYKTATPQYTKVWFKRIENLHLWISRHF